MGKVYQFREKVLGYGDGSIVSKDVQYINVCII